MEVRDMSKTVAKAYRKIPAEYMLTADEVNSLHRLVKSEDGGELEAFIKAFRYGFVLGTRAKANGKVDTL